MPGQPQVLAQSWAVSGRVTTVPTAVPTVFRLTSRLRSCAGDQCDSNARDEGNTTPCTYNRLCAWVQLVWHPVVYKIVTRLNYECTLYSASEAKLFLLLISHLQKRCGQDAKKYTYC